MGLYLGQQKIANLGETFTPREIQSVNGKTAAEGNITVYGSDISVSNSDNRNISQFVNCLSGMSFDLNTQSGIVSALSSLILQFGGTIQ